jgi:hypothetical protein
MTRSPLEVLHPKLASALGDTTYWFVIGGQAVRCFLPYRPSRDADFGVFKAKDLKSLVAHLQQLGRVEILETEVDTIHINWEGIDISVFVLPHLVRHVEGNALSLTGVLATKTHAILDRGTRRDFFDLYVMLHLHSMGILECLKALSHVYETEVNQGLVLRALTYFDDADAESPLPGEGKDDWQSVKDFFSKAVAALIVPPTAPLNIQSRVADVVAHPKNSAARSAKPKGRKR